jgi:hypothetical protein
MEIVRITAADIENGRIKDESKVADCKGHIELDADLGIVFATRFRAAGHIFAEAGCGVLSVAYRIFAGVALWLKSPTPEQLRITCKRLAKGQVCYGELIETYKVKEVTQ